MLKRTFHYETIRSSDLFKVNNLLHLTVSNQGTTDVLLFGTTIKPGGTYNIPSDGHPFLEALLVDLKFSDPNAIGNNVYVTYTSLVKTKPENC